MIPLKLGLESYIVQLVNIAVILRVEAVDEHCDQLRLVSQPLRSLQVQQGVGRRSEGMF